MTTMLQADPLPLRMDDGGSLRVGQSRLTLDIVLEDFKQGMSPEEIAEGYETIELADVYGVIAYYLRHRDEIDVYLARREEEARLLEEEIARVQPARPGFKAMLLERQARMEKSDAPAP